MPGNDLSNAATQLKNEYGGRFILKGDETFRAFGRHRVESVTLRKYVDEYEYMRK